MKTLLLGILFLTGAGMAPADDLNVLFDDAGLAGTLVIERLSDGREWTAYPDRADIRFAPASTFKIPNALIQLQLGTVTDPDDDQIDWDGVPRGGRWDEAQSLRTAFQRSAVWAFQAWTAEAGHAAMQAQIAGLDYGNGEIGNPENVTAFWLDGTLRISAREQVGFLRRLEARELPFHTDVMDSVIDIMEADRGGGWVLRAKTGWGIREMTNIGWYVGWLEAGNDVYFFALNVDLDFHTGDGRIRERLVRQGLESVTGFELTETR
ncbi:penicillin-binding transpeptidase domain-containing protein [Hyphobacterium sp.]|jgi:beta-lactamase class D|uniref:penicillin-binding transpeptidase domain-containing protein n=1 Tax=Hyphobacterium sp. TaxID=2004662 RepID=UPI003BADA4D6